MANLNEERAHIDKILSEDVVKYSNQYLSIKNENQEIYVEDIPRGTDLKKFIEVVKKRLQLIRQGMPKGTWTATIEGELQRPAGGTEHKYDIENVETGETQTSQY